MASAGSSAMSITQLPLLRDPRQSSLMEVCSVLQNQSPFQPIDEILIGKM